MTKLRPAYRNGHFIGFCLHQYNEHSQCLQPVTPVNTYSGLMRSMEEFGLTDPAAVDEYVRTAQGPLKARLDSIDQSMRRPK